MTTRRRFIGTGLGATLMSGIPSLSLASAPMETSLRIYLESRHVGEFTSSARRDGDTLRVSTRMDIIVAKILGLPLYSYKLNASETWRSGRLQQLVSSVASGGKNRRIVAALDDGKLVVDSEKYSGEAPADAGTSSYFSRDLLDRSTWISTESGKLLDINASRERTVEIDGKRFVEHRTTGDLETRLFYTRDGRFGGAVFDIKGRSVKILPGRVADAAVRLG